MIGAEAIRKLQVQSFNELPVDCGERHQPGIVDEQEWRDWSNLETTPDQMRIEDYLDCFSLEGKSILHVGVGNSSLARRFHRRAQSIFGTTVVPAEVETAAALGISNYTAILHNKHSGDSAAVPGSFDFIVDNNPSTFCCCMTHFALMLDFYADKLSPKGQIITDRVGLGWTTSVAGANPRWGFSFDDLSAFAALAGLAASHATLNVIVLARGLPVRPGLASRIAHVARSPVGRLLRSLRRITRE